MDRIREFDNQNHTKSIVIENADEELSINLVYGDIMKILCWTINDYPLTETINKLKERYELCKINDCVCKPKKIRIQEDYFNDYQDIIDQLKWIPNIVDVKVGMHTVY